MDLVDVQRRVGRYQIEKVIGRGAMGVVYLAYDPQIGRRVALKTVSPPEGARPEEIAEARARFVREAQAVGKLLHPHIVTLFDVLEERGNLYIAMEHVEGPLLDHFCSKGNLLPMEQVVQLVSQGLSALTFAHKHGIIHRDIKPANLMVVDGRTLKVMDFGVARQPGAHITQEGTVVGTPHYMSPEQIEGKALDGRSDLFSMGVVLYELVTGERPFPGEAISTVIYRILNENPQAPRAVNREVPELLSRVILKALAKKPEERFASALAFQQALARCLDPHEDLLPLPDPGSVALPHAEDHLPPPPSAGYKRVHRRHHLSRRTWRIMLLGTAAVVVLFVAGTLYLKQRSGGSPVKPPPSQEELPSAVNVVTDPPGAKLYLDGAPVDAVTLPPGDTRPHTLEARLGCLAARTTVASRGKAPQEVRLKLAPGPFRIPVTSEPAGAKVLVDGADTGLVTPAQIERKDCTRFSLALALEGWQQRVLEVDPRKQDAVQARLEPQPEEGVLRVEGGSGRIQIYLGSQLLGPSGREYRLPAGEHTLRFTNTAVRGSREETVTLKPGETLRLRAPTFETGAVFLYGKPANEGKVYVDGTYLEELPLNGTTPIAVGSHTFQVVGPGGRRVTFGWKIVRGEQSRVVDFEKGRVENP